MRVGYLVAPARAGGLETVVRTIARCAPQAGLAAGVLVLDQLDGRHPFVEAAASDGLAVTTVASGRRRYLAEARAVVAAAEAARWDLLHSHGYHADLVGLLAAQRSGRPIVSTAHGTTGGDWKNRAYEFLQRRAFRRFDRVIAVSRALADRIAASGVRRERIAVIPNAFAGGRLAERTAARRALGLPAAATCVGWVGRLSREKGPDVALEALALLARPAVRLSMIGAGPDRTALESRAARLGIAERVAWHGSVPDAGTVLAAFDAVVLSSRTEGTPMVLLEAMSAGVPVVAAAVGGVPDVVSPREALLVPPERPDLLAQALREALTDPEGAARRVAAAKARLLDAFAVGPWIAKHAALYAEVLDARARRRGHA